MGTAPPREGSGWDTERQVGSRHPPTLQSREVMDTRMLVCPELTCSYVRQLGQVSLPVFQCGNLRLREAEPPAEGHTARKQSSPEDKPSPALGARMEKAGPAPKEPVGR